MKKLGVYLPSLILSVILVFMVMVSVLTFTVKTNVTAEKGKALAESRNISLSVHEELEKYFSDQYNTTGIPSDVYMSEIGDEYIKDTINMYTESLFSSLESGNAVDIEVPKNQGLESNIEKFFSDYAESINYEKDDIYEKKISDTIENTYKIIGNYCDIYKYLTLQKHGVIAKISKVYSHVGTAVTVSIAVSVFLALMLILINRKNTSVFLYWVGFSLVIAGIFGTAPGLYLTKSGFFDSFVIKQPQVFKAFTGSMYGLTEVFTVVNAIILLAGVCLVVAYAIICRVKRKAE